MADNLLIVESPAKCKSLGRYLGKSFNVLATYGHIRDLESKSGAVDVENGFKPKYSLIEKNIKHLNKIKDCVKKSKTIYLATDPDREGEIISWHMKKVIDEAGLSKNKEIFRVVFHEITKQAVLNALENPCDISMNLVNAQQARRILDYLVGFNLSPLLWKKIRYGFSAGRVQSPTLRMVADREHEIEKFVSKTYWKVFATSDKLKFALYAIADNKLTQFSIKDAKEVKKLTSDIEKTSKKKLIIKEIEKKIRKRQNRPPIITSTLQQDAYRRLGFRTRSTMMIAQKLYEGFSINGVQTGLITYMRTDSVNISKFGVDQIRDYIKKNYDASYLSPTVKKYTNKSKNAQESHEAIRPVDVNLTPDKVKKYLTNDQYKLYKLIWNRSIATQMTHATIEQTTIKALAGSQYHFRISCSNITHPGFLVLDKDDKDSDDKDALVTLPPLKIGEKLNIEKIDYTEHHTEPPPRYTEASLVKDMEKHDIGRPSTYATTLLTLLGRKYVAIEDRQLFPTEAGLVVNEFLVNHFTKYVDYDFTARLEDILDEISRGEKEYIPVLNDFWKDFNTLLIEKEKTVSREEAIKERILGKDPISGKPVSIRYGRYGYHVQIGTRDDKEKPLFGPLLPGMKAKDVDLELALQLATLPKILGTDADGEKIATGVGPFGSFIRYQKNKFVSLRDRNPLTLTLVEAKKLIQDKTTEEKNRVINEFPKENIKLLKGRFGDYINDGKRNVKIPKTVADPKTLTLKECLEIIKNTPVSNFRRRTKAT